MFWLVQLEPLEERYSKQWSEWIPTTFDLLGLPYDIIEGEVLTDTIEKGAFLDVNSSHYQSFTQLRNIARRFYEGKIKNGDKFFVYDIEFPPGKETIKMLAQLQKMNIKLFGFLHACSVTTEDFVTPCKDWMKYSELSWLKAYDGIFVGTEYHKSRIVEERIKKYADVDDVQDMTNKIHVTGNPFNSKELQQYKKPWKEKDDLIVFPNRWDYEKRPNLLLDLAHIIKQEFKSFDIIITTSRSEFTSNKKWLKRYAEICKDEGVIKDIKVVSKADYYKLLGKAKFMISTTVEENFGYCNVESMAVNTVPIVPNAFSHPEVVGVKDIMYNDLDDVLDIMKKVMDKDKTNIYDKFAERLNFYDGSVGRMIKVMLDGESE